MPFTVGWDDQEHTIILLSNIGTLSVEELKQARAQIAEMLTGVDHPVDLIIDARHLEQLPQPAVLRELRDTLAAMPPVIRTVVRVGIRLPPVLANLGMLLLGAGRDIVDVGTLDEAYSIIAERRGRS